MCTIASLSVKINFLHEREICFAPFDFGATVWYNKAASKDKQGDIVDSIMIKRDISSQVFTDGHFVECFCKQAKRYFWKTEKKIGKEKRRFPPRKIFKYDIVCT